jgi:Flp pilus assembly protein TadD
MATICIIVILSLLFSQGCSNNKSFQTISSNSDVKKLIKLQQQKAAALKEPETPTPAGFEMTADSHEQIGDNYLRQGNAVGAFTEYQKALEKEPGRIMVRYKMGMLFLSRGLLDEAQKEFDYVHVKDANNAYAYYGKARVAFAKESYGMAKEDIQKALTVKPDIWQALTLLGVIHDREGHHNEAEEAFGKALSFQPKSATILNDLGVSRYLMGHYDDSAEAFLKAFKIEPDNQRICNNLGLALYKLGRTDDAIEAFRRGGDQASAFNNVGYLAMKDSKLDEAVAALEKAIEAKPSYYDRAQKNLEKAKAAVKNNPTN